MKVVFCFAVAEILWGGGGGWGWMHFVFALNKIFDQKKTSYFFYRQYKVAEQRPSVSVQKWEETAASVQNSFKT